MLVGLVGVLSVCCCLDDCLGIRCLRFAALSVVHCPDRCPPVPLSRCHRCAAVTRSCLPAVPARTAEVWYPTRRGPTMTCGSSANPTPSAWPASALGRYGLLVFSTFTKIALVSASFYKHNFPTPGLRAFTAGTHEILVLLHLQKNSAGFSARLLLQG